MPCNLSSCRVVVKKITYICQPCMGSRPIYWPKNKKEANTLVCMGNSSGNDDLLVALQDLNDLTNGEQSFEV